MFKVDKISIIDTIPDAPGARSVFYWDKAGTAGKGAYTAGVWLIEVPQGLGSVKYVIRKVVRGQWSADEREEVIKREAMQAGELLPGTTVVVEQEPGSGGKESAEATLNNLAGVKGIKARADRPSGDKVLRADPFSVQVNMGKVGILNGPWVRDFLEELRFFPYSHRKDQVDAAAGAFNWLVRKRGRAGGWSKPRGQ